VFIVRKLAGNSTHRTENPTFESVMRVNRNVRSWWRRFIGHLGTLLLSIVMGLIVWLIAINQENPLVTQPFPERLTVEARNIPSDLRPTRDLSRESVQVTLRAPRTVWQGLSSSALQAFVDLANLGPGSHTVPIEVSVDNPEVVVKAVEPAELNIRLDDIVTATVPVTVTMMDNTAFGYDWQSPTINPPTVTIRGPASQVAQAVAAEAPLYLRGANSDIERFQALDIVDAANRSVSQLEVLPPMVEVVVPVVRWPGRKEVAVRVDLEGQPASGYRLGQLKVDPSMVVLRGNSDALNSIGFVETAPVSVEDATGDVQDQPKLLLPEGVNAFEGDVVDVIVGIVPVEDSTRITLRPILRGLGPGLSASIALDTMDVIVSGPQSILDALEPDDVFVILNLSNRKPGTHVITPDVVYPDGIRLEGVSPETIEVIITNGTLTEVGLTTTVTATATAAVTATVAPTQTVDER
jgi:YbbR domain-containing protein